MKSKLLYLFLGSIFFVSCQKELSLENGAPTNVAEFTYDGAPSACTSPTIAGTYMAGTPLGANNKVTLAVTVTKIGSYTITTNVANGVSFSVTGTFTVLGSQNITLVGSGTSTAAGSYTFTPGATGCNYAVTFTAAAPPATFTYASTAGLCTTPQINGTFKAGTPLTLSNTIVLAVNVTVGGSYSVSTNAANGVTFSGAGVLATGAQTITLTSTNTPTTSGSFDYTPTGGCTFPVVYAPAGGGGSGTNFLKCKIDGVLTNFNKDMQSFNIPPPPGFPPNIALQGIISDVVGVQQLSISVQDPVAVNTGAYNNVTFSTILGRGCGISYYPTGFPNLYFGSSVLNANTSIVNITSLTSTRIEGNFSGTLYDQNGGGTVTKNITEGSFSIGL